MSDIIVPRFQLVDLTVPGASGGQSGLKFFFSDQPFLRHATHKAVESYFVGDTPVSPITNNPVASNTLQIAGFLTLVQSGTEVAQKVPLAKIHNIFTSYSTPNAYNMLVNNWQIDWSKSYVELTTAPNNTSNISFLFGVYYTPGPDSAF